jgi:hypothetical protein
MLLSALQIGQILIIGPFLALIATSSSIKEHITKKVLLKVAALT